VESDVTFKNGKILVGDVLERLKDIPDETIDCIITSPPYKGLRDYGVEGQWGNETSNGEFLLKMNRLMKELFRVLKNTGTCWINLGDGYVEKSLMCVPWEFLLNCKNAGWIIRNVIPWIKDNPMPQSTIDRLTNFWEPVFFMVKNSKYNFNLDAIRVVAKFQEEKIKKKIKEKYADNPSSNVARLHKNRIGNPNNKQDQTLGVDGKPRPNYYGFNERWKANKEKKYGEDEGNRARTVSYMNTVTGSNEKGKNPGDVFFINTKAFPEAHFATFPPELPEIVIKCGCPPNGVVLDPFLGSGTVGLVAEQLNKKWIGIELNEKYVEICKRRISPYDSVRIDKFL